MRVLFFLLFFFQISVCYSSNLNFKNDFAFFCKSYNKDLEKALNLYESFLEFTDKVYPFYFVIPEKDLTLFKNKFLHFKKKPNFLTEEEVLKKCNIDQRIKQGPARFQKGWMVQQMVKMCISQTLLAKDYITLDSDVYFVKKINKDLFYNENGQLKLVGRKIGSNEKAIKFFNLRNSPNEDQHRYETASYVRYIFRPEAHPKNNKVLDFYDFVSHYALWDSNIMNEIKEYVRTRMNFDFYDLIKISPWEMQWYGQFIQSKHTERFDLMSIDFVLTLGYENERKKNFRCLPENGYDKNYIVASQSEINYKMPNTLFCKIKTKINYLNLFYIRKFLWNFIY